MDTGEGYLPQDGISLSPEEMLRAAEARETGFSLQIRLGWMLADLFKKEALQSFAECVGEYILLEERQLFDEEVCMTFVKSEFVDGVFSCTLSD